jgi:hypothetical protein
VVKTGVFRSYYWLILAVAPVLLVFHAFVYWRLIGDISNFSPETIGSIGDSFGWLNALFSGLAFAGLIITVIMQREELGLQREDLRLQSEQMRESRDELAKSADAQRDAANISAISILKKEYNLQIEAIDLSISKFTYETSDSSIEERKLLVGSKEPLLRELEDRYLSLKDYR